MPRRPPDWMLLVVTKAKLQAILACKKCKQVKVDGLAWDEKGEQPVLLIAKTCSRHNSAAIYKLAKQIQRRFKR